MELLNLKIVRLCFIRVVCAVLISGSNLLINHESMLVKRLLGHSETSGIISRPVQNHNETMKVRLGISLIQLIDLNEQSQILKINTLQTYAWNSPFLKWNRDDFGGLYYIRLPISKIWSPDLLLQNTVQPDSQYISNLLNGGSLANVFYNGDVTWIPRMNLESTCSIDFANFPYDTQECHLKFVSRSYHGWQLDPELYTETIDMSYYLRIRSQEWEVINTSARKNVTHYSCCEEPFPALIFTISLKRVDVGLRYALILPTSSLAVLTVVIFFIPPVVDVKINFGMLIFLGYFLLLVIVHSVAPSGGAASSRLVQFLSAGMCIDVIAIILSSMTMNLTRNGTRGIHLPPFLKKIFNDCIGRLLCVCSHGTNIADDDEKQISSQYEFCGDWETFATILDRIFGITFGVLIFILAVAIR